MAIQFTEDNQAKFDVLLTRYPNKQAALLPTLWLIQEQYGFISQEAMEYVGALLDVSPAHVFSVVTFYTMYHQKPVGRYNIQLCRTLSCALLGAGSLYDYIKDKLKIQEGEVSSDGKFSITPVECLASCGTGPMMMINEKYYENLDRQRVDEILDSLE